MIKYHVTLKKPASHEIFKTGRFYQDYMVLNHKKCHYLYIGENTAQDSFTFEDLKSIESKFIFHNHIKNIFRKLSEIYLKVRKLSGYTVIAFSRVAGPLGNDQGRFFFGPKKLVPINCPLPLHNYMFVCLSGVFCGILRRNFPICLIFWKKSYYFYGMKLEQQNGLKLIRYF